MKDRILQVMSHEGLTSSKFAEAIGIQRSAMSHIISGRNNPSLDVLLKVLERFNYVDSDWLLFGKGEMMRLTKDSERNLFTNIQENENNIEFTSVNRADSMVNTNGLSTKTADNEIVTLQNVPSRSISKIMVFYSDNTFDTFVLEKSEKE